MNLVSIIVPVYNVEKYLEECIRTLVSQTYQYIEIILVDDGSTDNSGKLCDSMAMNNSKIRVIHKKNEGLGFARNTGLDYVNGEYVLFFDSDDFADSELVEQLINGIKKNEADTCVGGFRRVTENGKEIAAEYRNEERYYGGTAAYTEFFVRMLGSLPDKHDAVRMSVWNTMYSMNIIKEFNIRFPSERKMISEDIVFNEEYYQHSKGVQLIDSVSYNYRMTVGSLTTKYIDNRFKLVCDLYLEMESRIKKFGDINVVYRLQRQFFVNLRSCYRQVVNKTASTDLVNIYNDIKQINNNDLVCRIVNEYPISKLQFKPGIFLLLIKHKASIIIAILVKIGVI